MNLIGTKVQVKFNQLFHSLQGSFSRPEIKFIRDMVFGLLKGGDVKLNSISRALGENISLKKTSERLGRNLKTKNFDKRLNNHLVSLNARKLNNPESYLILDLSDICKTYAKKMAGLATVRDGSTKELRPGYWLCNVIGLNSKHEGIHPLYSELYSIDKELTSENARILEAIETVGNPINQGTWVLDRGGDRGKLMIPMLKSGKKFIIRQMGTRHLEYKNKSLPLKTIAKKVKLKNRFKSKGKEFKCGAVRVRYQNKDLWLVVSRYKKGGYFYLLCHFPEIFNPATASIKAMEGYSKRWTIEEVHRHVKEDFNLEDVRLLTYQSLKNLMPLVWLAISFLYAKLNTICLEMIIKAKIKVLVKEKLSEISGFIYYKLYKVLKCIFSATSLRKIEAFKGQFSLKKQMILEF